MRHHRVGGLQAAGREELVREIVVRVELAQTALAKLNAEPGALVGRVVLEACLAGFPFVVEEVCLEGKEVQAELRADAQRSDALQRDAQRSDALQRDAPPATVKQEIPPEVLRQTSPQDLAAALDGRRRVWVKPGHFARALEPKLEGLGMARIRTGLYVGGYTASVTDDEAVQLMARLRELRIGYEQEAMKEGS